MMCLLPICLSLEKFLFKTFAYFSFGLFVYYCFVNVLGIFRYKSFIKSHNLNVFFCVFSFHSVNNVLCYSQVYLFFFLTLVLLASYIRDRSESSSSLTSGAPWTNHHLSCITFPICKMGEGDDNIICITGIN